jgi:hypothetical protein
MEQPINVAAAIDHSDITMAKIMQTHRQTLDEQQIPNSTRMVLAQTANGYADEHAANGNHEAAELMRAYAKAIITEVG